MGRDRLTSSAARSGLRPPARAPSDSEHRQTRLLRTTTTVQTVTWLLTLVLAGCATSAGRPAASTYGCAKAVADSLPPGLTDYERHCLASAGIAGRCSRFEAWVAGWGKEIQDAFGGGDPSLQDLAADRAGRRCASPDGNAGTLLACCRRSSRPAHE